MTSSAKNEKRVELVVRQFDFLLAQGLDCEQALEKIKTAAPDEWLPLAEKLSEVVNRADAGITRDTGPFGLLSRAMVLAAGAGVAPDKTLRPMLRLTGELRDIAGQTRAHFLPKLTHTALLALFGLLLCLAFVLFILPSHTAMYANFNVALPAITGLLDRLGFLGLPLVFAALLLLAGVLWALAYTGSDRLAHAKPLSWPLRGLTGFGQLTRLCDARINLTICDSLTEAGAEQEWIIGEASATHGKAMREINDDLDFAGSADTLAEEIRYQLHDNLRDIDVSIGRTGQATIAIIKTLVFAALAVLIGSIYVPIVQFASL